MQVTVWSLVLLGSAVFCFGLTAHVYLRPDSRDRALMRSFMAVAFGAGWWAIAYALQLAAVTVEAKLFWLQWVWIGPAIMLVAWPMFVLRYADRGEWTRGRRIVLLAIVPLGVLGIVFGSALTEVMYLDPSVEELGGLPLLTFTPGTVLQGVLIYSFVLNFATYLVLAHVILTTSSRYRRQATMVLVAGIIPLFASIVGRSDLIVSPFLDLTPFAFVVSTPLIWVAITRMELLDLTPLARDVLFEDLENAILVVDEEGRVIEANQAARALFGTVDADEELPEPVQELLDPVDALDERPTVAISVDGTSRQLESSLYQFDHNDRCGTLAVFEDVTDRTQLAHRYRSVVERAPVVLMTVSPNGTVRYVSPSIERILGYAPDEIHGDSFEDIVHPNDRVRLVDVLSWADSVDRSASVELRLRHAEGSRRLFEVTGRPIHDGEILLVGVDVTDRREYEQRLQVINRVLRHDLRNRANIIGGYAELLKEEADEETGQYIDSISQAVADLVRLSDLAKEVDQVLTPDSELTTTDVVSAVAEALDRLERRFPHVSTELSAPDSAQVQVDSFYPSMLDNLLENAVEHNDADRPVVSVTVRETGETVEVAIADNGPGIPPEEREILETERETPLQHSSGLGLWLVKWLVERAGGEIAFESNKPRGTVVRLRLLAAAPEGAAKTGRPQATD